jgi:hypothetical protein
MRIALTLLLFMLAGSAFAQTGGITLHSGSLVVAGNGHLVTTVDLTVAPAGSLDATAGGLAFTGATDQTLDAGGAITVASLRVDKSAGTLALGHDVAVTHALDLAAGTVDQDGNLLLLAATVEAGELVRLASLDRNGATLTEPLAFDRFYRGVRGWRMIAAPLAPEHFTSLNAAFHTQGAPGADFATGSPVLYYWDPTAAPQSRWQPVTDYTDAIVPGRGYAFFAFESFGGTPVLPTTWRVRGAEPDGPVVASLAYDGDDSNARFNLLGNPFAAPIDWHQVRAAADLQATYYVWDAAANGGLGNYAAYNSAGVSSGNANRHISAFQGFWAETGPASPATISFSPTWKHPTASPLYVGRAAATPHLRLELAGEGLEATSPVLLFIDDEDREIYNSAWPGTLAAEHVAAWWTREQAPTRLLFMAHRTPEDGDSVAFDVVATRPGTYTLTWPALAEAQLSLPITVVDAVTGDEVKMEDGGRYLFEISTSHEHARSTDVPAPASEELQSATTGPPRFTLHFGQYATSSEETSAPGALTLAPIYPNPARGSVTLQYSLPKPGEARLEVFDLLGRRVALIESGMLTPGIHTARLESGGLSAGSYLVRLTAGAESTAQRLTVVR